MKRNPLQAIRQLLGVTILMTGLCLLLPTQAASLVYLNQALPLFPADARVIEVLASGKTQKMSETLDQITLRILGTPTGKIFCGAVSENLANVHNSFFLNQKYASQAMEVCRGYFARKQPYKAFEKHFILVLTDQDTFKVDGWTSPRNETFIFMKESEPSQARFIRTLAHEMAIALDRKEQIGNGGIIDFPQLGIKENLGSCTAISILRDAQIKHSLSALRAFEVESQIISELNIEKPTGFADWKNLNCEQKLAFMLPFIKPLAPALAAESWVNSIMDQSFCETTEPVENVKGDNLQKIKTLSELTFEFTNGAKRNVCDFMTEGLPFFPGISFRGGPGPRIGGGGWARLKEFDDFQKKRLETLNQNIKLKTKTRTSFDPTGSKGPLDDNTQLKSFRPTSRP